MSAHKPASVRSTIWLNALALVAICLAVLAVAWRNSQAAPPPTLLKISLKSTPELFRDLNPKFAKAYEAETGVHLVLEPSERDPDVTLALPSDVAAMQGRGMIAAGWAKRLPYNSEPYTSTIVFVVRKGNPKSISDWSDLVRKDVSVGLEDPRTSENGKLTFLAAWGSVTQRGGTAAAAHAYVSQLYTHSGNQESCDVRLTWENEALQEAAKYPGDVQIVYPPLSIRAGPAVVAVDAAVARHHSEAPAKAYLQYLFSPAAQDMIAQHGYRPADPTVLKRYAQRFPGIELFSANDLARDSDGDNGKFFAYPARFVRQ
jgi:sulfate/thiosulfate-binding protein